MGLLDLFKKKSAKSKDLSETIPEKEKKYYQPDSYYTDVAFEGTQFEKKVITFEERKKTAIPSDNGLYPAEILLLEYCTYGTYPNPKSGYPGFWWFEYGIRDVGAVLKTLSNRGFVEKSSVRESLSSFTLTQLKKLLVAKNQPISGRKADLIFRIVDCYSDDELLSNGLELKYKLTEKGQKELEENAYVPYVHKSPRKTIEGSPFGKPFNVWSINKALGMGNKSNWKQIIEEYEKAIEKESEERNTVFMENLKKIDFEGYQELEAQNKQLAEVQEARRKYDESNDLTTYIIFWEKLWATGGLLFKGSKWLFELPDLYIQAKRFDDAEQLVKRIKRTKSDYSEKADYYLKKIEKQKNKKKEGLL
ncbi:MAG: SAP domain-containing protein [Oscillospiraceae bacterium]|nr:SAP domain-containing protein [Oscillospiraceae bacterium]